MALGAGPGNRACGRAPAQCTPNANGGRHRCQPPVAGLRSRGVAAWSAAGSARAGKGGGLRRFGHRGRRRRFAGNASIRPRRPAALEQAPLPSVNYASHASIRKPHRSSTSMPDRSAIVRLRFVAPSRGTGFRSFDPAPDRSTAVRLRFVAASRGKGFVPSTRPRIAPSSLDLHRVPGSSEKGPHRLHRSSPDACRSSRPAVGPSVAPAVASQASRRGSRRPARSVDRRGFPRVTRANLASKSLILHRFPDDLSPSCKADAVTPGESRQARSSAARLWITWISGIAGRRRIAPTGRVV